MSDKAKMSLAERVGRMILFPLAAWDDARQKKREEEARRIAEQQAAERQRIETERRAAEQERIAKLNEEKANAEQTKKEHAARGERARFRCQLLFDTHAHRIGDKFTQEKLDKYFKNYMNDTFPVDLVERRGQDLEVMIKEFVEEDSPVAPMSASEIKAHFDKQRKDVILSSPAEDLLEAMLAEINYREDQAMMNAMRQK